MSDIESEKFSSTRKNTALRGTLYELSAVEFSRNTVNVIVKGFANFDLILTNLIKSK